MKRVLLVLLSIISILINAQNTTENYPVTWKFSHEQVSNNQVDLKFSAFIFDGDHLYTQDTSNVVPTYFSFNESHVYNKIGSVSEEESIQGYDPQFDIISSYFENKTTFIQRIQVLSEDQITVNGQIDYIACNEERCYLPMDPQDFSFNIRITDRFEENILGCMDSTQSNYNPKATADDGSCYLYGCTS